MKTVLLAGISLSLSLSVFAQAGQTAGSQYTATERTRIEAERAQEKLRFEKAAENCYQRFAVNDCLREVAVERRKIMDEYRRQEIILNNVDRRLRAGEQLQKLDEKKSNASRPKSLAGDKPEKTSNALSREQELENQRAFEEKQLKARQRIEQRDQQLEKKGTGAKPLPVPP
jgi:colicin import membrane protein